MSDSLQIEVRLIVKEREDYSTRDVVHVVTERLTIDFDDIVNEVADTVTETVNQANRQLKAYHHRRAVASS